MVWTRIDSQVNNHDNRLPRSCATQESAKTFDTEQPGNSMSKHKPISK